MSIDVALFKRLTETAGIPGHEEQVAQIVHDEFRHFTGDVRTDALGNVIATLPGRSDSRVMVVAHMDEIGFLVKHVDRQGFLRLQPLGGGRNAVPLVAQRVLVTARDGSVYRGALQVARRQGPPAPGETPTVPTQEELFVDLGLPGDAARAAISIGDMVTMDRTFERAGDAYLSKAIDDRVGVLVLIEALRALHGHESTIYAVASTQEEVGTRGAAVAGYALEPTVVLAVDDTPAHDYPGSGGEEQAITRLGSGAAIKVMDTSLICHSGLVDHLRSIAERESIPYQMEVLPFGGTDAGAVQRQRGGVPAGVISIPCRYAHTANEMASVTDVRACVDLLARYLEEVHTAEYAVRSI